MQVGHEPGRSATVAELLERVELRQTPAVAATATLYDVMRKFHGCPHSQSVYVVDSEMQLLGAVALDKLVRHAFSYSLEPRVHGRELPGLIAHETASDLMRKRPLRVGIGEELGAVLNLMIRRNHHDVPVVDDNGALVGDITLVDLLEFLMKEESNEQKGDSESAGGDAANREDPRLEDSASEAEGVEPDRD